MNTCQEIYNFEWRFGHNFYHQLATRSRTRGIAFLRAGRASLRAARSQSERPLLGPEKNPRVEPPPSRGPATRPAELPSDLEPRPDDGRQERALPAEASLRVVVHKVRGAQ